MAGKMAAAVLQRPYATYVSPNAGSDGRRAHRYVGKTGIAAVPNWNSALVSMAGRVPSRRWRS